ncbi:MFS transporter [Bacillus sp. MHSD_36]|uniref:MFS transporter n=1 Tax=unclassified Bacillus (in: firmicutes) TaxID=185979 RepID=UPI002741574F|nr:MULTISPECIES: MFS transporter [unclassified Bacillus (in: firmicutes)]MDP7992288.1 MFS transporter [Bacillus sp. MHSD_36]MDR4980855.1 MFS transporter [Bacillus sp. MHSD_37]
MKKLIKIEMLDLLKSNKNFLMLWISTILTSVYERAFYVVVPIYIYDLTNNARLVGFGSLVETIALLLFGLISGFIVDSFKTKKILLATNFALLILFISAILFKATILKFELFLIFMLFFVALGRTNNIARNSAIYNIFEGNEKLGIANASMGMIFSLALILGPIIGSNIYVASGIDGILYIGIAIMGIVVLTFKNLSIANDTKTKTGLKKKSLNEIYFLIKNNRAIYGSTIFQVLFITSCAVFSAYIYVFIKDFFKASEVVFSLSITFQGIGNFVGGFLFSYVDKWKASNRVIFILTLMICTFELLYIIIPNTMLMLVCNFIVGLLVQIVMVISRTFFMKHCDSNNIGRMTGLNYTIVNTVSVLMISLSGYLLSFYSIQTILFANLLILAMSGLVGFIYFKDEMEVIE